MAGLLVRRAAVLAVAALAAPLPLLAQDDATTFVTVLGTDTVAVERFRRTDDRVQGTQIVRTPRTIVREYVAHLSPSGAVERLRIEMRVPGDAGSPVTGDMDLTGDSARVRITQGDSTRTLTVPLAGPTLPSLSNSIAMAELALEHAQRVGADSVEVAVLAVGAPRPGSIAVLRASDGWIFRNIAGDSRVAVDEEGRIALWDGRGSTFKVVAEPSEGLDLEALAADFAARERQGAAMGVLSPLDSLRAEVAGAVLEVEYSRPSKRGREIFGTVVPWGEVWRTGANRATMLTTSDDLLIGGTPVPAGSYSVFSIPRPEGWTLIVNRQTGQAGTAYDPSQDLARIEMRSERMTEPVEQFTIAVEPDAAGGRLVLLWDDVRAWVPVARAHPR